ncbi:MAG: hypothetical protein Q4C54_06355 [Clostridia bacterium]|nr:hypothetical protein [Clostridia bacterium]
MWIEAKTAAAKSLIYNRKRFAPHPVYQQLLTSWKNMLKHPDFLSFPHRQAAASLPGTIFLRQENGPGAWNIML